MSIEEVRNALRQRPFRPFRLFITDGGSYEIRHLELCVPGARTVFVGIPAAVRWPYEWFTETLSHRHFMVPAEVVNEHGRVSNWEE